MKVEFTSVNPTPIRLYYPLPDFRLLCQYYAILISGEPWNSAVDLDDTVMVRLVASVFPSLNPFLLSLFGAACLFP